MFWPTMMRASSLSSVSSVGVGQDVGADRLLERAREEREIGDEADARNRHRPVDDAGVETLSQRGQVGGAPR
jgi:ribose 1,5-bisphosphokinase PhnN